MPPTLRALFPTQAEVQSGLRSVGPTLIIVALIACVLVPLPTALVDLLLSISLAGAALLIVAGLSVRRATDLLNFPALLLLVTLYRLALNVSTTRLILSQADAGRVIDAFASFVIRDDLIVGGVMFAIITIIQYVVIARGSERVAEVAARFALDGLPGHQTAIDADLRSSAISTTEAARRRAQLIERSNFYGAMDGAMRFVKGDAIAGLAIIAINLVGGLAIGVGKMGYTWQHSLDVYGRLTVGDGLMAQIPALLVSIAAGILVARVDREHSKRSWLRPVMLIVPAGLLVTLALIPRMPSLAFITTATALVSIALLMASRMRQQAAHIHSASSTREVTIRLPQRSDIDLRGLQRSLDQVRIECAAALRIHVPPVVACSVHGQPTDRVDVDVMGRAARRTCLAEHPPLDEQIVVHAYRAIMEHSAALIDLQDLDGWLEEQRAIHPMLVKRTLEHIHPREILIVIRGFLRDRIPLPPIRAVLTTLAENPVFGDTAERPRFVERARLHLAAYWVRDVVDALERLGPPCWVRLLPDAEAELCDRSSTAEYSIRLTISDEERERWIAALREVIPDDDRRHPLVVVATPEARPVLAELVRRATPHIPVLSLAELEVASLRVESAWVCAPQ